MRSSFTIEKVGGAIMTKLTVLVGALVAVAAVAAPAGADEAKTSISASMFLNAVAPRAESRAAAFDESLKENGPAARARDGEVLPDGSVRYGNVTVTVRNPCPPEAGHYDPPPRPGRRARN
jgi:hypothetical protein